MKPHYKDKFSSWLGEKSEYQCMYFNLQDRTLFSFHYCLDFYFKEASLRLNPSTTVSKVHLFGTIWSESNGLRNVESFNSCSGTSKVVGLWTRTMEFCSTSYVISIYRYSKSLIISGWLGPVIGKKSYSLIIKVMVLWGFICKKSW